MGKGLHVKIKQKGEERAYPPRPTDPRRRLKSKNPDVAHNFLALPVIVLCCAVWVFQGSHRADGANKCSFEEAQRESL